MSKYGIQQSGRVVYFYEEPQVLKNKIIGVLVGGLLVPLMIIPSKHFWSHFFQKTFLL
jgi:hypothetical protein